MTTTTQFPLEPKEFRETIGSRTATDLRNTIEPDLMDAFHATEAIRRINEGPEGDATLLHLASLAIMALSQIALASNLSFPDNGS